MIIYLILFVLALIGVYIFKKNIIFLCFYILIFSFIIGFRGESVGTDTASYMRIYEDLGINGYLGFPEPIYGILCVISNIFGLNFPQSQTLITLFSLGIMAIAIKKGSPNYALSILLLMSLYYIFYAMNIYREMMACFILVYAYYFLYNKNTKWKKAKFLLFLILAIGFHKSAIFLLPVLFLDKLKLSRKIVMEGLFLSFAIGVVDVVGLLSPLMGWYQGYLDVDEYVRAGSKLILAALLSLYWMIGFLYLYIHSDKEFKNSIYLKLLFIGIIIYNLLIYQDLGLRVLLYFSIPLIIGLPIYIQTQCRNKTMSQSIIIGYTSLYGFVFSVLDSADAIPYVTFNYM